MKAFQISIAQEQKFVQEMEKRYGEYLVADSNN